jgi:phospholipid/cholesterol/gamma-HCH transport system ATP-binding protein
MRVGPNPAPATDSGPVVAFRNVSIGFDGKPVLNDISFTVAPGETRILLGPAGVGKSVLLKLVNGLIRPDEGSIQLFGREIATMPEDQLFPCAPAPGWFSRKARSLIRSRCATMSDIN